ncbi:hypothetical protein SDC9_86795 [bioreactor metagenome]|uniref:Uncharacterized protein n=1 Tax=bioreactor metagenome TaxID=1076179 RepID=A0A644ZH37_9ZZZZ
MAQHEVDAVMVPQGGIHIRKFLAGALGDGEFRLNGMVFGNRGEFVFGDFSDARAVHEHVGNDIAVVRFDGEGLGGILLHADAAGGGDGSADSRRRGDGVIGNGAAASSCGGGVGFSLQNGIAVRLGLPPGVHGRVVVGSLAAARIPVPAGEEGLGSQLGRRRALVGPVEVVGRYDIHVLGHAARSL